MNKQTYTLLETHMLSCMKDSAHDKEHIYRVLYLALDIAKTEPHVDYDVLIASCLLHDIGRQEQFDNPQLCHAQVGSEKAYHFLAGNGFEHSFAEKVRQCILSHRFRKNNPPQSLEAKILFDADKIDVSGAVGIARTLLYHGHLSEPLYTFLPDGSVSDGTSDNTASFFQEYKRKLEGLYSKFYTTRGTELAGERQEAAIAFYNSLFDEVNETYHMGKLLLDECLD
ncbi:MAG: HD domain-containing protein [Clostridiaceae bacterium]|nr:HD domain-containing protein [Clostridiaceae bacterium]